MRIVLAVESGSRAWGLTSTSTLGRCARLCPSSGSRTPNPEGVRLSASGGSSLCREAALRREPFVPVGWAARDIGLLGAKDLRIWTYAAEHEFLLASKDTDFYLRSLVFGGPPKVIWLRNGNASSRAIAVLLRERYVAVGQFAEDAGGHLSHARSTLTTRCPGSRCSAFSTHRNPILSCSSRTPAPSRLSRRSSKSSRSS